MLVPFTFEISRYSYLISLIRIHVYDATIIEPNYLHFKNKFTMSWMLSYTERRLIDARRSNKRVSMHIENVDQLRLHNNCTGSL